MSMKKRIGDAPFGEAFLAVMGEDVHLPDPDPDGSTIRAVVSRERDETLTASMNSYRDVYKVKVPTRLKGTLAAGRVINIRGSAYYVVSVSDDPSNGMTTAHVNEH